MTWRQLGARIPQMDRLRGDLLALFIEGIQRLAQQEACSFCFHPLHPPRLSFTCWRKPLIQLPNLVRRAGCTPIHLGNPGLMAFAPLHLGTPAITSRGLFEP